MKPIILLVDDEPSTQFGFSKYFSKAGYTMHVASSLTEGREAFLSQLFDALLLDLNLPDGNGIDWIPELRENYLEMAIIVITGSGDIPIAVEAMRRGADHFLTKPVKMDELEIFLRKSLELGSLKRGQLIQKRLARKDEPFFGESPSMKKILELASISSENDSSILLLGETGVGKGVLARWVHNHSARSSAPFVEVNCSGLRGKLLASELFGHARGAFTSAVQDRQGLLEAADGGTLFLDEIGDMDLGIQPQFLKVIEEKQYRRLGEVMVRRSDFRLICASNKDLMEEVRQGKFRNDLYYRIQVFPIHIPPLRQRIEDLKGVVLHLLRVIRKSEPEVSQEVMQFLENYSWPGNIRELRNVLERALLLAHGNPLAPEHFPGLGSSHSLPKEPSEDYQLEDMEERHIKSVINRFDGDTKKAAEALGISRAALYRKLKKFTQK